MQKTHEILCIGSVLWDVIGKSEASMPLGADRPGRIRRVPGGVCLNIAIALVQLGLPVRILTCVGNDPEGQELLAQCRAQGIDTDLVFIADDLPTDVYMAIESPQGLVAAIADAHSLEHAGTRILTALHDGTVGSNSAPYEGCIALDGNLTVPVLEDIAASAAFARADLRIAPASPGKARRLGTFLQHERGTLYVNLEEANLLSGHDHGDAVQAAHALVSLGAPRALVTHGGQACCDATADRSVVARPPVVEVQRVTGAGDTFMAAHMAAELMGKTADKALEFALDVAAHYISHKD